MKEAFSLLLKMILLIFVVNGLITCADKEEDKIPWISLFDGENLHGWSIKGGDAKYRVEDSAIVGSTVHDTPNTFLTTDKEFGDFILEVAFKVDSSLNSGIQIRSNSFEYYRNGRVHGYQVEIDPSERASSGGIYDEGRRGWLFELIHNSKAQKAFRQNEWNTFRIEAIGDTIKTWINRVPASHLIDDKTSIGFIGLQVHGIKREDEAGKEVRWKDLRIITEDLEKYSRETPVEPVFTKNRLTRRQKKKWKLLWDGETTAGWRGTNSDNFPEKGWIMENGNLIVLPSQGGEDPAEGDIVTTELFGDFVLEVDFKLTEGADSGIKYFVNSNSSTGLEYQIIDDENHPDARMGVNEGSRTSASLYDLMRADSNKHLNPTGEWNTARIILRGSNVEHWLNGTKVLEYNINTDAFRQLALKSEYDQFLHFKDKNRILLQNKGTGVAFKNIKIRPLSVK